MLDVVSVDKELVRYKVNKQLLDLFKAYSIFQSRDSSDSQDRIVARWKVGGVITCQKKTLTEPFSVNGAGNAIYSAGSFCDIVSPLPVSCNVGRYGSIAGGLSTLGFRHPVESAVMSCVSFRWKREIMRAHSIKALGLAGETPNFRPVPVPQKTGGIQIGHDVWIGSNVVLPSNVKIGNGAVVAANTIVVKDVPPYAIVGGNPGGIIKYRFSQDVIELLESSKWWEHAPHILHQFNMSDPENFATSIIECKSELEVYHPESLNLWSHVAP
jgi:acetyltransferase-like isoleucine patch superfamily enzyme